MANKENDTKYGLSTINYILIAISALVVLLGFFLMTGVESGEVYNPEIYAKRYVTVGPMISFAGFLLMIVSILVKLPNKKK